MSRCVGIVGVLDLEVCSIGYGMWWEADTMPVFFWVLARYCGG